jgi:hypothetical protein
MAFWACSSAVERPIFEHLTQVSAIFAGPAAERVFEIAREVLLVRVKAMDGSFLNSVARIKVSRRAPDSEHEQPSFRLNAIAAHKASLERSPRNRPPVLAELLHKHLDAKPRLHSQSGPILDCRWPDRHECLLAG